MRPSPPALLLLALLAALALGLALPALGRALDPYRAPSPAELVEAQAAAERAEALAPLRLGLAAAWELLPLLAALAALGLAVAWGWSALARYRAERWPDSAGRLPVERRQLVELAGPALGAYHAAQVEAARRPLPPSTLHYRAGPQVGPQVGQALDRAERLPGDVAAPPAPSAPTLGQLLDRGQVGAGRPLLLGWSAEGPITGSWRSLYSTALAGLPGSGKTSAAVGLLAQSALQGARLIVIDPHAGAEASLGAALAQLRPALACGVAESPRDALAALDLAGAEMRARLAGRRPADRPLIVAVDELSALMRGELAGELAQRLEGLAQEGRKVGAVLMLLGQVWSVGRSGGSPLRDALASCYLLRCRAAQARAASGLGAGELPADLLDLAPGTGYLVSTAGELRRVALPLVERADLRRVAGLLGDGQSDLLDLPPRPAAPADLAGPRQGLAAHLEAPAGPRPAPVSAPVAGPAAAAGPARPGLDPQAAAIIARYRAGASMAELARELAGTDNGRRYSEARQQVEAALRSALAPAGPGEPHPRG